MLQRQTPESRPEERFVELFQDVFGPAAAASLNPLWLNDAALAGLLVTTRARGVNHQEAARPLLAKR